MLTETKVVDQITITEDGTLLVRETTRILRDGMAIAQHYHRTSLSPGQDVTAQADKVRTICAVVWTEAIVSAYQAQVAARERG